RDKKNGDLPKHLVQVREGNQETVHYFTSENTFAKFADQHPEYGIFEDEEDEEQEEKEEKETTKAKSDKPRVRVKHVELHESNWVGDILDKLEKKGLVMEHYAASEKPLYELTEGDGDKETKKPIFAIPEILASIKEIGRRGVQIKRFKGLGEMNAGELFETTMNPEKRKLLKVDLNEDNAVDADKMFTILMGDVVEPRRQFIEDNALNVRNLDV